MRRTCWMLVVVALVLSLFGLTLRAGQPPGGTALDARGGGASVPPVVWRGYAPPALRDGFASLAAQAGQGIWVDQTVASEGPSIPRGELRPTQGVLMLRSSDSASGGYSDVVGALGNDTASIQPERMPAPLRSQGWTVITQMDFEVGFPGAWELSGDPTWADTDYRARDGSRSGYCAGGGSGSVPAPGPYPNDVHAVMVYGPFDLSGATDAQLLFYMWLKTESNHDFLYAMASIDGVSFSGSGWHGNSGGWLSMELDLTDVYQLGNVCGQSSVWVAFLFRSDAGGQDEGAYLDDIILRAYLGTPPTAYITHQDNEDNAHTGAADGDMFPENTDCIYNNNYKYNCPELRNPLAPIEFNILIPSLPSFSTAELSIYAHDVDEEGDPSNPFRSAERDEVYLNGHLVGRLTGAGATWSTSHWFIDPSWVQEGDNLVEVRIDTYNSCWCTSIAWGQIALGGGGGTAYLRSWGPDHGCWYPGSRQVVQVEVDTSLERQEVTVELNVLDAHDINLIGTSQAKTIYGTGTAPFLFDLEVPFGATPGQYTLQVIVYDTPSGLQQDYDEQTVRIDAACATPTATPAAMQTPTGTATASPTATQTLTPTPTASQTATLTPTASPTPTPTATPTPSATAVATLTATPTATQTATMTASPTATPSASPTAVQTATPTATQTPAEARTVILQNGVAGYAGCSDTRISAEAAAANFGSLDLKVGARQRIATLIRFDLSGIPSDAVIESALLHLYGYHREGLGSFAVGAYAVRHAWVEGEASWEMASSAEGWGEAGCNDIVSDRAGDASDEVWVGGTGWHTWSVRDDVQSMVSQGGSNQGWLLRQSGEVAGVLTMYSSEHWDVALRPKLVVRYRIGAEPTSTPSASPTSTQMPAATQTATPMPTGTLIATHTATLAPTASPTATQTPGEARTVILQNGVAGCAGCADTRISAEAASANFGSLDLKVGAWQGIATLIRFDLSGIPSDATIESAELHLYGYHREGLGSFAVGAYAVSRAWVEGEASWQRASFAEGWGEAGCSDIVSDRAGSASDEVWVGGAGWYTWSVGDDVQRMVSEGGSNDGWLVRQSAAAAGVLTMYSSEHGDVEQRPKLVVTYRMGAEPTSTPSASPTAAQTATPTPAATPTAAPTATQTQVATPTPAATPTAAQTPAATMTATQTPVEARTVTLQNGVAGYAGCSDTRISAEAAAANFGSLELKVGARQRIATLIRFDLSGIPSGAVIESAELHLYGYHREGLGSFAVGAYAVKRAWVEGEASWEMASLAEAWGEAGCNDIVSDRAGEASDEVLVGGAGWYTWSVRDDVQRMVSAGGSYSGWLVRQSAAVAGVLSIYSSEHADVAQRPKLVVTYRVGHGGARVHRPRALRRQAYPWQRQEIP